MQVGSLVKCLYDKPDDWCPENNEIIPNKGVIYTVRAIFIRKSGTFLHFEEIVNAPAKYRDEFGEVQFGSDGFKEVQPPLDVATLFADQLNTPNENRLHK